MLVRIREEVLLTTELAKHISGWFSAFFNGEDKPVLICVLLLSSYPKIFAWLGSEFLLRRNFPSPGLELISPGYGRTYYLNVLSVLSEESVKVSETKVTIGHAWSV